MWELIFIIKNIVNFFCRKILTCDYCVSPSPKNWFFWFFRLGLGWGSNFRTCWDRGLGLGLGLDNMAPHIPGLLFGKNYPYKTLNCIVLSQLKIFQATPRSGIVTAGPPSPPRCRTPARPPSPWPSVRRTRWGPTSPYLPADHSWPPPSLQMTPFSPTLMIRWATPWEIISRLMFGSCRTSSVLIMRTEKVRRVTEVRASLPSTHLRCKKLFSWSNSRQLTSE